MTVRLIRQGARIVLPVGITAAVITLAAAPALAATNIAVSAGGNSLSDGDVLSANGTVDVKGTSDATASSRQLKLSVSVPGRSAYTLKTGSASAFQSGQLSAAVDTSCPDWSASPCVEAVNGTYTFTFQAGSATTSSSVQLRVPPAAPAGFQASVDHTVVSFTWTPNTEPDLMGYDIADSSGNDVTPGGVDSDAVCDASGCGVSVDFGSGAQGTSDTFFLTARRHTSPGSGGFVASDPSSGQTVNFPAPPPPPSPAGSPGGASGGSHGSGSGGSTGSSAAGGGSTGKPAAGAKTGAKTPPVVLTGKTASDLGHSLPTVTAAGAPDLPSVLTEVKPLPQGTYKPTLAYPDQVTRSKVAQPAHGVTTSVLHDVHQVLDTKALWRALAGMAVLMLAAAHLRAFVERVEPVD